MRRLRPALAYQDPRAPVRRLADRYRRPLAAKLREALKPSEFDQAEAVRLIRDGRWREVWGLINWDHFRETMRVPLGSLAEVVLDGGVIGAARITQVFDRGRRRIVTRKIAKAAYDEFTFDRFDEETQARIRSYQDALIAELGADARQTIDQAIIDGLRAGKSAEDVAADIRQVIGLTARQAQAVLNYENALRTLDSAALYRALAPEDDRAMLQRAIAAGQPLDEAAVRQLADNYAESYLDYRAATIAQTEATRAASMGLQDSYRQAVDRGLMPAEAVTRHWQVALDEKTCAICLSIPDQNPDGVGVDQPFVASGREFMMPPVHVGCRCSLEFVTDLDLVPDEGKN